jgi:hypothetical protein
MKGRFLLPFFIILFFLQTPIFSQKSGTGENPDKAIIDSLAARGMIKNPEPVRPDILLSHDQALMFLQKTMSFQLWKNLRDPLRSAIGQLIFEASNPPFDSAGLFLERYPYDSIAVPRDEFFIWEPMRFRLAEDTLIRDGIANNMVAADTLISDSLSIRNTNTAGMIAGSLKDTTILVIVDTLREVRSNNPEFPFRYYRYPFQSDSIKAAVGALLNYVEARDSGIIRFTGTGNKQYSLWLNSKSDKIMRFWLSNDMNDSVTVWVNNPERNTIGLQLENGVSFRRPTRQGYISAARIDVEPQDHSTLVDIGKIITKQIFWRYHTETAFVLNQAFLTNWVKGGENSVSTTFDVTFYADYINKPKLVSSYHFARIKYGLVASATDGIRKNLDLLETNSKINHKAFGKFDFSGIMLFKTQVSKGYNYPNDSVPVSRFMNPAILTLGLGLDYKPDKFTSLNFSPFSYKGTFVPDTATIDQTKYGVPENRKSKHEPGASFLFSNEFRPFKSISVLNRLQLFTSYANNPLNIDVDWEMILKANLNWFTEVRLNTHLIFDDDTKTPVYDKDDNPVIGDDGVQVKAARVQFKELLGLSFVFRF